MSFCLSRIYRYYIPCLTSSTINGHLVAWLNLLIKEEPTKGSSLWSYFDNQKHAQVSVCILVHTNRRAYASKITSCHMAHNTML